MLLENTRGKGSQRQGISDVKTSKGKTGISRAIWNRSVKPLKKCSVWLCGYVMKQDNEVFFFNAHLYNAPPTPLPLPYSLPHVADTINAFYVVFRCFGGEVSWHSTDAIGATFDESSESITHQIVDRPGQGHRYLSR